MDAFEKITITIPKCEGIAYTEGLFLLIRDLKFKCPLFNHHFATNCQWVLMTNDCISRESRLAS